MILDDYHQRNLTIGTGKANAYGIAFALPFLFLFGTAYFLSWFRSFHSFSIHEWALFFRPLWSTNPVMLFGMLLGGVVVHELIHGICWGVFAFRGYKSISYGIVWKYFTPYCHCNEPLLLKHYIFGGIMPAVVLGFIPSVAGIISGNVLVFLFGMWFTMAAGGDFMIIWMLRKQASDSFVQDHPSKMGCLVLERRKTV